MAYSLDESHDGIEYIPMESDDKNIIKTFSEAWALIESYDAT
jgi:hypothetical protein